MSIVLEHAIDSLGKKRSSLFIPVTNIDDKTSCFFPWFIIIFPMNCGSFGSSQGPWGKHDDKRCQAFLHMDCKEAIGGAYSPSLGLSASVTWVLSLVVALIECKSPWGFDISSLGNVFSKVFLSGGSLGKFYTTISTGPIVYPITNWRSAIVFVAAVNHFGISIFCGCTTVG